MRKPSGLPSRSRRQSIRAAIILILVCLALSYLLATSEHPKLRHFPAFHPSTSP